MLAFYSLGRHLHQQKAKQSSGMAATGTETIDPNGGLAARARQALARLTNAQKILLMVAIAASIGLAVAASTWLKQADYRILFSNVAERDGGA